MFCIKIEQKLLSKNILQGLNSNYKTIKLQNFRKFLTPYLSIFGGEREEVPHTQKSGFLGARGVGYLVLSMIIKIKKRQNQKIKKILKNNFCKIAKNVAAFFLTAEKTIAKRFLGLG